MRAHERDTAADLFAPGAPQRCEKIRGICRLTKRCPISDLDLVALTGERREHTAQLRLENRGRLAPPSDQRSTRRRELLLTRLELFVPRYLPHRVHVAPRRQNV